MLDASHLPQFAVLPVSIDPPENVVVYVQVEYVPNPPPPPKVCFGLLDDVVVYVTDPSASNPPPPPK